MQNMGEAIRAAVANMTSSPSDEIHICPFCNQVVPKMTVYPCGIAKEVQPRCRCEVENYEKDVTEATERKRRNEIMRKFSFSSLGQRFEECRFGTLIIREGMERAAHIARDYAAGFHNFGGESLLLWGDPGNGKSHLAAAVCHELKDKALIPVFQTVPELLERIRSTFGGKNPESERDIMDALRDCDLLTLDDLGAEKVTDWTMDVLFRVIDGRYRQKKPTLFTTNFSPTDLLHRFMPDRPNREDEIKARRIHDRIIEASIIIENKATSYRMQVAKDRARSMQADGWTGRA